MRQAAKAQQPPKQAASRPKKRAEIRQSQDGMREDGREDAEIKLGSLASGKSPERQPRIPPDRDGFRFGVRSSGLVLTPQTPVAGRSEASRTRQIGLLSLAVSRAQDEPPEGRSVRKAVPNENERKNLRRDYAKKSRYERKLLAEQRDD